MVVEEEETVVEEEVATVEEDVIVGKGTKTPAQVQNVKPSRRVAPPNLPVQKRRSLQEKIQDSIPLFES